MKPLEERWAELYPMWCGTAPHQTAPGYFAVRGTFTLEELRALVQLIEELLVRPDTAVNAKTGL